MFLKFKKNKKGFLVLEVLLSIVIFLMIMVVAAQSLSNSFFVVHRLNQKNYLLLKGLEIYSHQLFFTEPLYAEKPLYSYRYNQGVDVIGMMDQQIQYRYIDLSIEDQPKDVLRISFSEGEGETDEE